MRALRPLLNPVVAACLAATAVGGPAVARPPEAPAPGPALDPAPDDVPGLLALLADPAHQAWRRTEREILREWSRSGSAAMDLLLQRGREALHAGDHVAAIEHLTALTDHAPGFAEGWNARAAAFHAAGQYGPALADIARALERNPHHWGALAGLGAILEATGAKADALRAFRAALAIHPNAEGLRERTERLERATAGLEL